MKRAARVFALAAAAALILTMLSSLSVFADFTSFPMSRSFPEDSVATYTAGSDSGDAKLSWFMTVDGVTYDFANLDLSSAQWINFVTGFGVSADGKTLFFEGITKNLGGAGIYCVCDENGVKTTSPVARVSVCEPGMQLPPEMKAPARVSVNCGEKAKISVEASPADGVTYKYQWYTSFSEDVADVKVILEDGFDGPSIEVSSSTPGTVNYCCMVESVKDGKSTFSYTNIIPVEFKEVPVVETEAPVDTAAPSTDEPASATGEPSATPGWEPPKGVIEISSVQLAMICLTVVVAILAIAVVIVVIILVVKKRR